jgi:glyoxylase-like metal-dependent hydrolase (beta-lactamase superfamily II)
LAHNQKLVFGDIEMTVFHTPGHAPGHVVFYFEKEGEK